jgi:hypothetical protein
MWEKDWNFLSQEMQCTYSSTDNISTRSERLMCMCLHTSKSNLESFINKKDNWNVLIIYWTTRLNILYFVSVKTEWLSIYQVKFHAPIPWCFKNLWDRNHNLNLVTLRHPEIVTFTILSYSSCILLAASVPLFETFLEATMCDLQQYHLQSHFSLWCILEVTAFHSQK